MIWQLSDMPDIIVDGAGDKYIGYEYIGENYSGNRRYLIEERDALFAGEVSKITGEGILLDLACGDGCLTVPCAANSTRIIAGDISNRMLSILQKKAVHNEISMENVTLCRMNALDIPLESESVNTVVADSMLHLISNPQKVINEIYRVLQKGGSFLCRDDRPGKGKNSSFDNTEYNQIVNAFYSGYWERLKLHNVSPTKYSWKFNRDEFCNDLFATRTERIIERGNLYEVALKDGFLPRFCSRGFSDQVDVPQKLHDEVIAQLLTEFRDRFGEDFADICFKGMEDDLVITIYTK
ncbi:MAG: class I SAM-dependent methyltransferase [Lachnospiraceae bacterium]|nr:class I SAM-dependent methyltransferase [Lachnospiraceae bacterium]